MKCAIVDDEPLALSLRESYIRKTPMLELSGQYASAVEAMGGLCKQPVDLLFLDIQMPELSGLDLSKMLDTSHTRIVFTTAFSQYAVDGYKVNALDYLLKPISYTDFIAAVSRAQQWFASVGQYVKNEENLPNNPSPGSVPEAPPKREEDNLEDYIFIKSDYKILRIRFSDILYIEGLKDYVKIHLVNTSKPVLSLMSMRSLETALPSKHFFRIHRSYIVNIDKVSVFERGQIVFGDKHLPVSDSYREQLQQYINARLLLGRA